MWLTASASGIGAGYNAMPLNDIRRREIISTLLGIPPSWEPTEVFSFGYSPLFRASVPSRPPLEGVVFSEYWGSPYERIAFREEYDEIKIEQKDIFDAIINLNLVESFEEGKVNDWMLERILDSAIWGPNPENFKHWRFLIIREKEAKEFLYNLVKEKKHTPFYFTDIEWQLSRLWYIKEEERMDIAEKIIEAGIGSWYPQADVLIIPLAGMGWIDSAHTGVIVGGPPPIFHISTGCCMQNIFIAATALGLGFNYDPFLSADFRLQEKTMRDFFGIPYTWIPLGVIGIGHPGEKMLKPPIPPLEFFFYEEYWGNPYKGEGCEI